MNVATRKVYCFERPDGARFLTFYREVLSAGYHVIAQHGLAGWENGVFDGSRYLPNDLPMKRNKMTRPAWLYCFWGEPLPRWFDTLPETGY